ncbi:MAG: DUF4249 family protein [Melioribacteraceae bacterium]
MKKLQIIFILLFSLAACEQVDIVEIDQEHFSSIVIKAKLISEQIFDGVSITRTQPLSQPYEIKSAEIINATVYIKINEAQVIPLYYKADGKYLPKHELTIKANNIYELFAKIDGNIYYSITNIPRAPQIGKITLVDKKYMNIEINILPNTAYGAIWQINSNSAITNSDDFYSITSSEKEKRNTITIRTQDIPTEFFDNNLGDQIYGKVFSFDQAFHKYFLTKGKNKLIGNTFVQSGGNVEWNVQGENVIGLFIGMAESKFIRFN